MKTSELLYKAADDIAKNGHNKGAYFADDTKADSPACLVGAIRRANGSYIHNPLSNDTLDLTYEVMDATDYVAQCIEEVSIPAWNDRDSTTAEDAILALKKAAYLAEKKDN